MDTTQHTERPDALASMLTALDRFDALLTSCALAAVAEVGR